MKIIKLIKVKQGDYEHYYVMFDKIPKMTYEKIGNSYVGSVTDDKGNIIFSDYLKYESGSWCHAFAGREIELNMKDGTKQRIKDHWYDCGSYSKHGEFIGIGAGTLEELQKCYVYCSININKNTFMNMIEKYLTRDKIYDYREVEDWCKLQYIWYPVFVNKKKIPFMMNKYGDMVEKESKKYVYSRYNKCKEVNGKWKTYHYFRFNYKDDNGNLIKIDANYLQVLKDTLPFSEEEIRKNCELYD